MIQSEGRTEVPKAVVLISDLLLQNSASMVEPLARNLKDNLMTKIVIVNTAQGVVSEWASIASSHSLLRELGGSYDTLPDGQSLSTVICKEQCDINMDIGVIVDTSDSITENDFKKMKQFVQDLIHSFDIGQSKTRIAVVPFGSYVDDAVVTTLQSSLFVEYLDSVVASRLQQNPLNFGTNTAVAIAKTREIFQVEGRRNVPKVGILLTDGVSDDPQQTKEESSIARTEGIRMIVVGVGNRVQKNELDTIAFAPEYSISLTDFGKFEDAIFFKDRICTVTEQCLLGLDIIFIIDASASITSSDFTRLKTFVKELLNRFSLSQTESRIGFVVFGTNVNSDQVLSFSTDRILLRNATDSRVYQDVKNPGSAIYKGIEKMTNLFDVDGRADALKLSLVFTDGKSDNAAQTAIEAQKARAKDIRMITVGIGNQTDIKELSSIASGEQLLTLDNFGQLLEKIVPLQNIMCRDVCSREYDLIFLIDTLDGTNLQKLKFYIVQVAQGFNIGVNSTRIAVQHIQNIPNRWTGLSLQNTLSLQALSDSLDAISVIGSSQTSLVTAFTFVTNMIQSEGRTEVPKAVVLISDLLLQNSASMVEPLARNLKDNLMTKIVIVNTAQGVVSEWASIASSHSLLRELGGSYDTLPDGQSLSTVICKEQCDINMDIGVIVDTSDSITENDFKRMKQFVQDLIHSFDIGQSKTRVAVVPYGSYVDDAVVTTFQSSLFVEYLDSVVAIRLQQNPLNFGTNTAAAIAKTREIFQVEGRQNVPKVGILLTDGVSDDPQQTKEESSIARTEGIRMIVIGVGNRVQKNELDTIAFTPEYSIGLMDFEKLKETSIFKDRICSAIEICPNNFDIIFLVDTKNSTVLQASELYLEKIAQSFNIGPDTTRVGVIHVQSLPTLWSGLQLKDSQNFTYLATLLGEGLHLTATKDNSLITGLQAVRNMFDPRSTGGFLRNIVRTLVVLSDRILVNTLDVQNEINALKASLLKNVIVIDMANSDPILWRSIANAGQAYGKAKLDPSEISSMQDTLCNAKVVCSRDIDVLYVLDVMNMTKSPLTAAEIKLILIEISASFGLGTRFGLLTAKTDITQGPVFYNRLNPNSIDKALSIGSPTTGLSGLRLAIQMARTVIKNERRVNVQSVIVLITDESQLNSADTESELLEANSNNISFIIYTPWQTTYFQQISFPPQQIFDNRKGLDLRNPGAIGDAVCKERCSRDFDIIFMIDTNTAAPVPGIQLYIEQVAERQATDVTKDLPNIQNEVNRLRSEYGAKVIVLDLENPDLSVWMTIANPGQIYGQSTLALSDVSHMRKVICDLTITKCSRNLDIVFVLDVLDTTVPTLTVNSVKILLTAITKSFNSSSRFGIVTADTNVQLPILSNQFNSTAVDVALGTGSPIITLPDIRIAIQKALQVIRARNSYGIPAVIFLVTDSTFLKDPDVQSTITTASQAGISFVVYIPTQQLEFASNIIPRKQIFDQRNTSVSLSNAISDAICIASPVITIMTTTRTTPPTDVKCTGNSDVVFMMDTTDNPTILKAEAFIINAIKNLSISATGTRVAVYNVYALPQDWRGLNLNAVQDYNTFVRLMQQPLPSPTPGAQGTLLDGLRKLQVIFSSQARPNIPQTAVIITNVLLDFLQVFEINTVADDLKANMGVNIIVINIGSQDNMDFVNIASPSNIYGSLNTLPDAGTIGNVICAFSYSPVTTTPSTITTPSPTSCNENVDICFVVEIPINKLVVHIDPLSIFVSNVAKTFPVSTMFGVVDSDPSVFTLTPFPLEPFTVVNSLIDLTPGVVDRDLKVAIRVGRELLVAQKRPSSKAIMVVITETSLVDSPGVPTEIALAQQANIKLLFITFGQNVPAISLIPANQIFTPGNIGTYPGVNEVSIKLCSLAFSTCGNTLAVAFVLEPSVTLPNIQILAIESFVKNILKSFKSPSKVGSVNSIRSTNLKDAVDLTAIDFSVPGGTVPSSDLQLAIQNMRAMINTATGADTRKVGVIMTDLSFNSKDIRLQLNLTAQDKISVVIISVDRKVPYVGIPQAQIIEISSFVELPGIQSLEKTICTAQVGKPVGECDPGTQLYRTMKGDCRRYVITYCDGREETKTCDFGLYFDESRMSCRLAKDAHCPYDPCKMYTYDHGIMALPGSCNGYMKCFSNYTKYVQCCYNTNMRYISGIGCVIDNSCTEPCPPVYPDVTTQLPRVQCFKRPVANEPNKYDEIMNIVTMDTTRKTCPSTQIYQPRICSCENSTTSTQTKDCKPLIDWNFNSGAPVFNPGELEIRNVKFANGSAEFVGNSYIKINSLSSVDFVNTIAIDLSFKSVSGGGLGDVVLLSNCLGGSVDDSSVSIKLSPFSKNLTMKVAGKRHVESLQFSFQDFVWTKVSIIYDGMNLIGFMKDEKMLRGEEKGRSWLSGDIIQRADGIVIGAGCGLSGYEGYVDNRLIQSTLVIRAEVELKSVSQTPSYECRLSDLERKLYVFNQEASSNQKNLMKIMDCVSYLAPECLQGQTIITLSTFSLSLIDAVHSLAQKWVKPD
ncbi:hypothetical protein ACJMK2_035184 [Sinanodonta woodiana]|uniref:Collagen alpha-3(VI) chain n=1 Tax=Sinanodonta woodiana TaxID=1069815 RepID=A0ABD3WXZ3_SINWO